MNIKVNGISDYEEVWNLVDKVASEKGINRSDFVMGLVRKYLSRMGHKLPKRGLRGRPRV